MELKLYKHGIDEELSYGNFWDSRLKIPGEIANSLILYQGH